MEDDELSEIFFLNGLMKNLIEKELTSEKNYHITEDLLVQILKDKLPLELNKDQRFIDNRKLCYIEVSLIGLQHKIIKSEIFSNQNKVEIKFDISKELNQNIIYLINIIGPGVLVKKHKLEKENKINDDKDKVNKIIEKETINNNDFNESIDVFSENSEDNHEIMDYSDGEENTDPSKKIFEKKICAFSRNFIDKINNDTYVLNIRRTYIELDGNLNVKNEINDIKSILGEYLFYPKSIPLCIEKEEKEEIKIKKDEKILIEVKYKSTLSDIIKHMKKKIEYIKQLMPKDTFYYFVFFNEENAKIEENNYINDIEEYINNNKNFKFFFFMIKNKTFFNISLREQIVYSLHFYNLIQEKMNIFCNKLNNIKNQCDEIKNKMIMVKNKIKEIMEKGSDKTKNEDIFELIKILN